MDNLTELASSVLTARQEKANIEASLKATNKKVREAEFALVAKLREQDIDGFKTHGKSFSVNNVLRATKSNEDALFEWLESNGFESVIRPTVHWATLNKVCAEELEEHGELPAGVDVEFVDLLSVRKA